MAVTRPLCQKSNIDASTNPSHQCHFIAPTRLKRAQSRDSRTTNFVLFNRGLYSTLENEKKTLKLKRWSTVRTREVSFSTCLGCGESALVLHGAVAERRSRASTLLFQNDLTRNRLDDTYRVWDTDYRRSHDLASPRRDATRATRARFGPPPADRTSRRLACLEESFCRCWGGSSVGPP